ncbi:hypothetical protein [Candidatus Portiera aleyrodidarum]|nr:hypothetical protein [Candidatus Portiera aleyrodidarum]
MNNLFIEVGFENLPIKANEIIINNIIRILNQKFRTYTYKQNKEN